MLHALRHPCCTEVQRFSLDKLPLISAFPQRLQNFLSDLIMIPFSFQRNVTLIQNLDVRDTILSLTLTALAPQLKDFQPEDYQQWFQVYLVPVMASILPSSLRVIPSNITCESYQAV